MHVGGLHVEICTFRRTYTALPQTHRRQAIPVPWLRAQLFPVWSPGPAQETPPAGLTRAERLLLVWPECPPPPTDAPTPLAVQPLSHTRWDEKCVSVLAQKPLFKNAMTFFFNCLSYHSCHFTRVCPLLCFHWSLLYSSCELPLLARGLRHTHTYRYRDTHIHTQ